MKRHAEAESDSRKKKITLAPSPPPSPSWSTVSRGTCNQNDGKFKGNGVQCLAMSTCAAVYSTIKNRNELNTFDIDTVLYSGDLLYIRLRPLDRIHEHALLEPEELPTEFQVGTYLAKINPMNDSYVASGLFPTTTANKSPRLQNLKNTLINDVFNTNYTNMDSYLFTGRDKTVSFWKSNNAFYLFNSHAVDDTNTCNQNNRASNLAHLFKCESIDSLCELLYAGYCHDHGLIKGKLNINEDDSLKKIDVNEWYSIAKIRLISFSNIDTISILPNSLYDAVESLSLDRSSHEIISIQNTCASTASNTESLTAVTASEIVDLDSDTENSVQNISKPKRGRPIKKKRGPNKKVENAHLNAVKKYNEKKPDVHRNASKVYSQKHPEVHRENVKKYTQNKPEINRDSVKKYTQNKPEIHRESVKKYTETKPEIHRESVKKYTEKNPEINRESVTRYAEKNPDIKKESVKKYNTTNRNVDKELRSNKLIGERFNDELNSVKLFALKKHDLSDLNIYVCEYCHARLFLEEKDRSQWCCGQNRYNVQNFEPLTEDFYSSESFINRPRAYNNLFSFSASGTTGDYKFNNDPLSFYKIQGRTYHRVFDLSYTKTTNNIGLYIDDSDEREKLAQKLSLDKTVITSINNYLHNVNPYIECFKRLSRETSDDAYLVFEQTSRQTHGNILGDTPVGREVAAIINTDRETYVPRTIAIWKIGERKPHTVDINHILYESFQYPLLYPHGNPGWDPKKQDKKGGNLTQCKYYRCLLLSESRFSMFGKLSEEWLVDMYSRMVEERLSVIENMQNKNANHSLRSAPLEELQDETIQGEGDVVPGRIYLPNSFTGGPRYMKVKYMDSIALVNRLGPPTFFITMTCNPKWPEIQNNLTADGKTCPQICARVFQLKLSELLRDLRSGAWFGKCMYITHVIEFQKRGLPHAHICLKVENELRTNTDIDKFVRADIPKATEADGRLRQLVLDHMIHGPCGPPNRTDLLCWDNQKQKCTRFFPKNETPVTYHDDRGFVHLRRDSKNEGTIKYKNKEIKVNDLWVVPYNAALLLKYNCHINVEPSSSRTIIKYLFKYIHKGPDEVRVAIVEEKDKDNEIVQYITKRYIGSSDAAWRILEFNITGREPNVKQLAVHLENRQTIFFKPGHETEAAQRSDSDLITYFKRPSGEDFDQLTYLDFYEKYIVHASCPKTKNVPNIKLSNNKYITRRQRGELVTRLFWVAPNRGEQFYLRLLLNSFPCRSFQDLYNLGGPDCKTFQEAAKAVGIADDDVEYELAMKEASSFYTGPRLRSFFVLLAVNGFPVSLLWDKFKNQLSEDLIHKHPNEIDKAHTMCLLLIDRLLRKHGTCLVEQGLPDTPDNTTELGRERIEYSVDQLQNFTNEWLPKLSLDQRVIFDYINQLIDDFNFRESNNTAIFIDGPAGTGKTFLLKLIAAHIRSKRGIVLCTASSGIAAQNYESGTTAHSMFRFPLDLVDDMGYWNITNKSQRAELIHHADVIIYDEAPMAHKYLIHLLDRSLRDLMQNNKIFGGKIIIFSGDFRQIPPVVVNAKTDSDVVCCSVKSSPLWQQLKTFKLTTSQRCNDDVEFSEFLLKLGTNEIPTKQIQVGRVKQNLVDLSEINFVTELDDLIDFVFPVVVLDEPDVCSHRAILTTHNASVREINSVILNKIPGEPVRLKSVDCVAKDDVDQIFFSVDTLNNLQPKGVPEHELVLKIDCVCMIMRNLSFADGLVNGTKVIVTNISPRLITVRKPGKSDSYFIPRILFKAPIEQGSPIEMCRRQFPLQVCYAMTVHKSQGQTIGRVGVDLRSDVFSHGQLYVALGRVREKRHLKVLVDKQKLVSGKPFANNVVYPQLIS